MSPLIKRSLSGIVFVSVLLFALLANWWVWALLACFLTAAISFEFTKIIRAFYAKIPLLPVVMASVLIYVGLFFAFILVDVNPVSILLISTGLILNLFALKVKGKGFKSLLASTFVSLYAALPFGLTAIFYWLNGTPAEWQTNMFLSSNYSFVLLALFILIWSFDSFAYLVGSSIGKHKIMPSVSPKKSWEGFFGGLILTFGVALLLHYLSGELNMIAWIGLAAIVAVFGTLGDFMESAFKRLAGVKDSGNIIPGHGGLFDRFDSFLMIVPFASIFLLLFSIF